jgi:uncharacterized protein (DUF1810 family)
MIHYDPYNLQRFVEAQRRCYEQVCSELKAGCKTNHWMWFEGVYLLPSSPEMLTPQHWAEAATKARYATKQLAENLTFSECFNPRPVRARSHIYTRKRRRGEPTGSPPSNSRL